VPIKALGRSTGLDLPPPFRLITLREAGDAFAHAKAIAGSAGAGTLVRVGRFDLAEFAVVLEPDEPLWSVRRIVYAGSLALLDALAAHAPSRCRIGFTWPGGVHVNDRLVGGARLAWPAGCDEHEPPAWLVFGAVLRTVAMDDGTLGPESPVNALDEQGFEDMDSGQLVETCARHLLVVLDAWRPGGFGMVAQRYLRHLTHEKGGVTILDDTGDLLIRRPGQHPPDRRAIAEALAAPGWFASAGGGSRR
jgi:biotin-(acetyl-CoA carboxylase) ligase